jgi:hypothetical protein
LKNRRARLDTLWRHHSFLFCWTSGEVITLSR